ncbi:TonB-dependent siderophore receptor [Pseudomonas cremoricolorata]|uniref:TonB-dependent siderophore receptor n=1 Tax=Pseudomonas cremoricolorata TaxID=157783 RepID=UPI00067698E0|nr:TonB-dependent receptor [Pseudomonas cremoricolorata]
MQATSTPFVLRHGHTLTLALALALGTGAVLTPISVLAASAAGTVSLHLAAQPLDRALTQLADAANVRIIFNSGDVSARRSPALNGRYSLAQALNQLLEGSGYSWRKLDEHTLVLEPSNTQAGTLELSTTLVNAAVLGNVTEGTGSYALGSAQVGGKGEQTLREIPQSVSAITRQRMNDQGLTSLNQVLEQTTGISTTGGNDVNTSILARGFALTNIQTDGGAAALRQQSYDTLPDMTPYDHVEVLRGSDGLYGGTGEPAGTINLVRKRALDHNQVIVQSSAGSWNNYRQEVDVTGPLGFDGKLRGRAAVTYEDKNYFYDRADSEKHVVFGTLEADLSPDTLVTVGGTYEWRDMDGYWDEGFPRYTTGDPLKLSRSTSLAADWSTNNYTRKEGFLKLRQQLNDAWEFNTSYTKSKYQTTQNQGQIEGPIDPTLAAGGTYQRFIRDYSNDQDLLDGNLIGRIDALGRSHELLLGVDYTESHRTYADHSDFGSAVPIDPFDGSIGSMPEPAKPPLYYETPTWITRKSGAYATLKAQLSDPLKLIAGARYTDFNGFNRVLVPSFNADTVRGGKESGIVTPYGGLVYELDDAWSVYTSYAQIYKPQTEYVDRSFAPLKAITGDTYELGGKGELLGGRLNVSSALYYVKRQNEAIRVFSATAPNSQNNCCYVADGEIVSKGIDAEVSGELMPGWQLFAGYTFNINEQTKAADGASNGKPLSTQTPKHLFKFFTTYQLPAGLERWKVGLGATVQSSNYVSGSVQRRLGDGTLSPAKDEYNFTQAGYAVWNSLLEYRIDEHWTAAGNLNNLFDKTYYQTVESSSYGNWYGAPRNFMLTLRGTF